MSEPKPFHQPGVYAEDTVAPHGVRTRPARGLELRRLSQQTNYVFFLPYIPLAVIPELADPVCEYAYAFNREVELVYWNVEQQLIPSLAKRNITTNKVFGLAREDGIAFLDFARGIIVEDIRKQQIARIVIQAHRLIEPQVSTAQSAEKILASQFVCYSLSVQLPDCLVTLSGAADLCSFRVIRDNDRGDPKLWQLARKIWNADPRPLG